MERYAACPGHTAGSAVEPALGPGWLPAPCSSPLSLSDGPLDPAFADATILRRVLKWPCTQARSREALGLRSCSRPSRLLTPPWFTLSWQNQTAVLEPARLSCY